MVEFRRATVADLGVIRGLVTTVIIDVYGHLIKDTRLTITSDENFANSMLAVIDDEVVGIGLSVGNVVDDLWLLPEARGKGIGSVLLEMMELEIIDRGYSKGRLRVLADNHRAQRFYERHGWCEKCQYPHEKLGHVVIEFEKALDTAS